MLPNFSAAFEGEEHQSFKWVNGSQAALLIHGFPGTPAEMKPIAEVLYNQGWTVQAPLLPGFGIEIEQLADKTYQDWLESLRLELEALKREYENVVLVGYSMGGALAICLTEQYPVDGLILFSPFLEVQHVLWKALPLIKMVTPNIKIFKLMKPDFSDPQTRAGILQFMPSIDLDDKQVQQHILDFELPIAMLNEIRLLGQAAQKAAYKINLPNLVIQGTADDLVKAEITRKLIQRFKQTGKYVEVNSSHEILNPEAEAWSQIKQLVINFAKEIRD